MNRLLTSTKLGVAFIAAALGAGCAGTTGPSASGKSTTASIEIARGSTTANGDCSVMLTVTNHSNVAWDGISYHIALHNKQGVSVGRLIGSPHRKTADGAQLSSQDKVLGVKCDQISGVGLVYFGYYPTGKKEVSVHLNQVRLSIK